MSETQVEKFSYRNYLDYDLIVTPCRILYTVFYQLQCALFIMENDAEIFLAHYTWKVAKEGFKMASMMKKLAMINSWEIVLEK